MNVSINNKIVLFCFFIFLSCNQLTTIDSLNKKNDHPVFLTSFKNNNNLPPTEIHKDFNLSLWANDSLAMDPIALSIDQSLSLIHI